jgi:hypothetical protein
MSPARALLLAAALCAAACMALPLPSEINENAAANGWTHSRVARAEERVQLVFAVKHAVGVRAQLEATCASVSDPRSAHYGKHLTPVSC